MRFVFVRTLSWLLVLTGLCLVGVAVYTVFSAHRAQEDAAEVFEQPAPPANETTEPSRQHSLLQRGDPVAELLIPRLDAKMFVVEGASKQELNRGPGHLVGSALPGNPGNCVIAGHRDTFFRILKDIQTGDDIVLNTNDFECRYRVSKLSVVLPSNTKPLVATDSQTLTLVTCYPFYYVGPAPKRFIVHADLIDKKQARAGFLSPPQG